MYQQSYEDYMRMVLGYQPNSGVGCMNCHTYPDYSATTNMNTNLSSDLEELYPNIFHILKPIVEKVCNENTKPMCREVLEDMTETIYHIIEEREEATTIAMDTKTMEKNMDTRNLNSRTDSRAENRHNNNNFLLKDLIKILILNRILNQNRPPMPGPRPPYPGPNPRPPMPRIYDYL